MEARKQFLNISEINVASLSSCTDVGYKKKEGRKNNSKISSLSSKENSSATN